MIQAFLGHADLDTTKIYLRLVPGHLRDEYLKAFPTLLPQGEENAPDSDSPSR